LKITFKNHSPALSVVPTFACFPPVKAHTEILFALFFCVTHNGLSRRMTTADETSKDEIKTGTTTLTL